MRLMAFLGTGVAVICCSREGGDGGPGGTKYDSQEGVRLCPHYLYYKWTVDFYVYQVVLFYF